MSGSAQNFNGDISIQNTLNVIYMTNMFQYSTKFNKDYIINWDTSKVIDSN